MRAVSGWSPLDWWWFDAPAEPRETSETPWNSAERFCRRCKARNIDSWFVASERWREAGFQDNEIVCPQCFTQAWEKATGKLVTWELSIDPLTLGNTAEGIPNYVEGGEQ